MVRLQPNVFPNPHPMLICRFLFSCKGRGGGNKPSAGRRRSRSRTCNDDCGELANLLLGGVLKEVDLTHLLVTLVGDHNECCVAA